ncbi:App1 family protein [Bifidobacterium vespertilionis]|uniref:DUF2183 domain-containing protein n=1 Tax=Bifidobacterium vespertilionis TaxID=2562524 RepID=A0A5J5DUC8_9BIFI|nr:phosphatase domain-containing protein [Bifidobacterium vespertilionis]KAA8819260.1 DUF2183 domain-containing protein [Bifidobacterium vespertilionis]KAA8823168.1 DUF2183 domain-containing protein [Bifidobacterium vespertilionis]
MSNRDQKREQRPKPIRARRTTTIVDAVSWRERIENKPILTRAVRRVVTRGFGVWSALSTLFTRQLGWYPRVEPYVGYGTESYSRLICRTVRAPENGEAGVLMRGIRGMLTVPAPRTQVRITVDRRPLETVQVGVSEVYDAVDPSKDQPSSFAISDDAGYLDLVAEHHMSPGVHQVTYSVERRRDVAAPLFTIPSEAQVGIISDVDDTIMVTQAPTLWKAAYNLLFLNPRKRAVVPGMNVLYSKIADLFPDAPFFYLSTSPWNVETSIRHFIRYQGYPEGPLLLRDLDPRPKTFIPTGVQHKLEFAEQLMADFPHMRFILIGDDGQKDPTTYATIAKRYPGRVICIAIRQLTPREASVMPMQIAGMTTTQPIPVTDVPVFMGPTGSNLMRTMLPFLKHNV